MSSFRCSLSPQAAVILFILPGWATADDGVEFNPYFMSPGSQQRIDLTRYNLDLAPAGKHSVELIVNGRRVGRDEITIQDRIVDGMPVTQVDICVQPAMLAILDINTERLTPEAQKAIASHDVALQDKGCLALNRLLPKDSVRFDSNEPSLNLTLPAI